MIELSQLADSETMPYWKLSVKSPKVSRFHGIIANNLISSRVGKLSFCPLGFLRILRNPQLFAFLTAISGLISRNFSFLHIGITS